MTQETQKPLSVLVISAHPDDEIACAGTLFKLKSKGASLYEVILTDASEGRDRRSNKTSQSTVSLRKQEMKAVAKFLGLKKLFWLGQEDLNLKYSKPLMLKLVKIIRLVKPTIVFLMNQEDF